MDNRQKTGTFGSIKSGGKQTDFESHGKNAGENGAGKVKDLLRRTTARSALSVSEYGHVAAKCTKDRPKETYIVSRPNMKKHVKKVNIEDFKVVALLDTSSDLTFMRSDEYEKIGSPGLLNRSLKFEGLGSIGNTTMGDFSKNVVIDDNEFQITRRRGNRT